MKEPLDADTRRLLEQVSSGELSPEDPLVREKARKNEGFREELEALHGLLGLLDRTAMDQRQVIADAKARSGVPGEEKLAGFLGLTAKACPEEPPPMRWWSPTRVAAGVGLAAAALAVVLFSVYARSPGPDLPEPIFMGQDLRLQLPEAGALPVTFRWTGTLPEGAEYRITVSDATGSALATTPLFQFRTSNEEWSLSSDELARLPAKVWVQLVMERDGLQLDAAPGQFYEP